MSNRPTTVAEISNAAIPLSLADAEQLAIHLQLDPYELTRPLTPQEIDGWRFYRLSAKHPPLLWNRVAAVIDEHGLTLSQASDIMGMRPAHLADALSNPKSRRVLSYETAQLLTAHLKLHAGPLALIPPSREDPPDDLGR